MLTMIDPYEMGFIFSEFFLGGGVILYFMIYYKNGNNQKIA